MTRLRRLAGSLMAGHPRAPAPARLTYTLGSADSLLSVYAHWRLVAGASVRVCPGCGLQFASNRTNQDSCSTRCQQKTQQRRLRKASRQKALATVRRVKKK